MNRCIICDSKSTSSPLEVTDHSITKEAFNIASCNVCGLTFTADPPLESEIYKYYLSEEYISHSDTTKGLTNKLYHLVRKIMLFRKHRLINSMSPDKELLDIGCGTGYFLNYMKNNGFQTMGIEADQKAREYGIKKFGLHILPPNEFETGSINNQFGTITMWHVLEHLYDPALYVKLIHTLLRDDGHLIVALPNPDCYDAHHYQTYWAGYDVPRHLWHFSPDTFSKFAKKMDFKIVDMKRLPFDSFYNSILSEKYQHNSMSLVRGGVIGLRSWLGSLVSVERASSVIFILRKA